MKLTITEPNHVDRNGCLEIKDARIVYPNFSGKPDTYNPDGGKRTFNIAIPDDEIYEALINDKSRYGDGWNVRVKEYDDGSKMMTLRINVKYKYDQNTNTTRGPKIYLDTGKSITQLTESTVGLLDDIDIIKADMFVHPYDSEKGRNTYRTAYLDTMWVYQRPERFADRLDKYSDHYEDDGEEETLDF